MRILLVLVFAMLSSPAFAYDLSGAGAFGGAVSQGYQRGYAQQLELERLIACNEYMRRGLQPPLYCYGGMGASQGGIFIDQQPIPRTHTICQPLDYGGQICRQY